MDRSERIANRTLAACCLGHTSCHLTMLMFPTLVQTMREGLGVGEREIGLAYWACSFLFGIGAPAAGWFTDRVGARVSLVVFFLGIAGGLSAVGLAHGSGGLWVGMAALGLANSIYHPAGMTAISLTQHARRGRSMGILGIAGSLGVAAGPLAAGLIGNRFGWRGAHLGIAGLALAGAAAMAMLMPGRKAMAAVDDVGMRKHAEKVGRKGSTGGLALILLAMAGQGLIYQLMMTATPLYVKSMQWPAWFDLGWLGTTTAVVMAMGIAGQILGGRWSDSRNAGYVYPRVIGITIVALVGLFAVPGFAGMAVLAAFMVSHFSGQPVENVLVAQRTASARRSLGYGVKFVLAFAGGSIIVPVVYILHAQGDLRWVFLIGAAVASLGVACVYAAAWMDRQPAKSTGAFELVGGPPERP